MVSGCRTYGGYGTEEAIPRQMQEAVQQFASELNRAQSDLAALSEAAEQNSALASLEARYRDLVAQHEAFLEDHRGLVERFQDGGSYRDLNRNYGAMISEQRLMRTWYTELHVRIQRAVTGAPVVGQAVPKSRYVVNPTYYDRVQNRRVTMAEALRGM